MAKKLLTNCPNCGAPLQRDGTCEYCGTKARYANELDINMLGKCGVQPIELELRIDTGDAIILIPMTGMIDSVTMQEDAVYATDHTGNKLSVFRGRTNVDFTFRGHLIG